MERIKLITIILLLISSSLKGQDHSSVQIFEGRGIHNNAQLILDLSYQNLKSVPIQANNPQIEILILDNNNIEELPIWISNLKNLKLLSVRNNNLTRISSFLSSCENLEQLYLSGNKNLSDLPNMANCKKLKLVDVVDTQINEIPISIRMMDNLFYFKYIEK